MTRSKCHDIAFMPLDQRKASHHVLFLLAKELKNIMGSKHHGKTHGQLQYFGNTMGNTMKKNVAQTNPIGSMYGIYANIGSLVMVNVTIYGSTMDPMGMDKNNNSFDRE